MSILQCIRDLRHILDNGWQRQRYSSRMPCTQTAIWGIVLNEKRSHALNTIIKHSHNMGMHQARNSACLSAKMLGIVAGYQGVKHFDGSRSSKVDMLTEVHLGKPTLPQQTNHAVVAQLLPHAIRHKILPSRTDQSPLRESLSHSPHPL